MKKDGVGELAFEHEISHYVTPDELWCVRSLRPFRGQKGPIKHTNWFATEAAARHHAAWISDGRGTVLSVSRYRLNKTLDAKEFGKQKDLE